MANIQYTGSGNERIVGTNDADSISALHFAAPGGGVEPFTQGANDTIFGRGGSDTIVAGDNDDLLLGGSGNDDLFGESGNDTFFGGTGSDEYNGASGNDRFSVEVNFSSFGTDSITGGSGFDRIDFKTGAIIEVNGSPQNPIVQEAEQGVSVNLVNAFRPGVVGDFVVSEGDEEGDIFAFVTQERGRIIDPTGSGFQDIEEFELTNFDDFMLDSAASHILTARGGNDTMSGGAGADVLDGGSGRDTVLYGGSSAKVSISLLDFGSGGSGSGGDAQGDKLFDIENVFGSAFDDFMLGDADANEFLGRDGKDLLLGGAGTDTVSGGDGDDTVRGGIGNDQVQGGAGVDTALFQDWNGATGLGVRGTINLNTGEAALTRLVFGVGTRPTTATIERDTLSSIENVVASDQAETITGNAFANKLEGRGGGDVMDGGFGADTLDGGDGVDTVTYAAATGFVRVTASLEDETATLTRVFLGPVPIVLNETDQISNFENLTGTNGNDVLTGDAGANRLNGLDNADVLAGLAGADSLTGGDGIDTADYSRSAAGVSVDLVTGLGQGGDAAGDTLISIERLAGSQSGDRLGGNDIANTLIGNGGDDTLDGRGADDTLNGGAGGDTLDGGDGVDIADYSGGAAVTVDMASLTFSGAAANDTFVSIEGVFGSEQADTLNGDAVGNILSGAGERDVILGRQGDDTIDGGAGDDELRGANDNDSIVGGSGADSLFGGQGDDQLNGGVGSDTVSGLAGDDTLSGGSEGDFFVFAGNAPGQDVITDFEDGIDRIQFDTDLVDGFGDLTIVGNGSTQVVVAYEGQSIVLTGAPVTLSADDFLF